MPFVDIEMSDSERAQHQKEQALAQRPRLEAAKSAVEDMSQAASRLKVTSSAASVDESLATLSSLCRELRTLCKAGAKPAKEKARIAQGRIDSLQSSWYRLSEDRRRDEFRKLREQVAEVRAALEEVVTENDKMATSDTDLGALGLTADDLHQIGLAPLTLNDNIMPGAEDPDLTRLFTLPVIATFNRPTNVMELESRGFDVASIAGYMFFRRVTLLGVNVAKCNAEGYDVERVMTLSLQKLGEKLNYRLTLMCEQGAGYPPKRAWRYFWYGPETTVNKLGGHFNNRLVVTEFQFPFAR